MHQTRDDVNRIVRLAVMTLAALIVGLTFGTWEDLLRASGIAAWLLFAVLASGLVAEILAAIARGARRLYSLAPATRAGSRPGRRHAALIAT